MKFAALVSGGKDSIYSIVQCIENGHELIACVHLSAPQQQQAQQNDDDNDNVIEESYMYQTAASEVVRTLVTECLGVPLIMYQRKGTSQNTTLVYDDDHENTDNKKSTTTTTKTTKNHHPDESSHDEVEDMYFALVELLTQYPDVEGICSGAILSNYQRIRIEHVVCNRLQLHSLCYLWRKNCQSLLLYEMIHTYGIEAMLVRTASPPGLIPYKHLKKNQIMDRTFYKYLKQLHEKYQFHICGEGGEYETLVLYCPTLFIKTNKRLVIDQYHIKLDDMNDETGGGTMMIQQYHTEECINKQLSSVPPQLPPPITTTMHTKCDNDEVLVDPNVETIASKINSISIKNVVPENNKNQTSSKSSSQSSLSETKSIWIGSLPHVRLVPGGLLAVSGIMSQTITTQQVPDQEDHDDNNKNNMEMNIIHEANEIFQILQATLEYYSCTSRDVVMVHLYLSQMQYFKIINQSYQQFFGVSLPPSRCCIGIGNNVLPNHKSIQLDCYVLCGSGSYLRNKDISSTTSDNAFDRCHYQRMNIQQQYTMNGICNKYTKLRQVLHVQSRSYWAPICVGPYSQVNTIKDSIHCIAGQIGLIPCSMTLPVPLSTTTTAIITGGESEWTMELKQAFCNVANILDALENCSLPKNLLSGLLYITPKVVNNNDNKNNGCEGHQPFYQQLQTICMEQIKNNANVIPGLIDHDFLVLQNEQQQDENNNENLYDGYEDEETMNEMKKITNTNYSVNEKDTVPSSSNTTSPLFCPLLVVLVPELPVGAVIEIEIIATTKKVASLLQQLDHERTHQYPIMGTYQHHPMHPDLQENLWDTGHDFFPTEINSRNGIFRSANNNDSYQITAYIRSIGTNCISSATIVATFNHSIGMETTLNNNNNSSGTSSEKMPSPTNLFFLDTIRIFQQMIQELMTDRTLFDTTKILNIRVYFVSEYYSGSNHPSGVGLNVQDSNQSETTSSSDTNQLRNNFFMALASHNIPIPAVTFIPVKGIWIVEDKIGTNETCATSVNDNKSSILFAIQAFAFDPIQTETNMWINEKR